MNPSLTACCLLLSVCLSMGTMILIQRQPKVAMIDLDRVISEISQPLTTQYPKGDVPKRVLVDLLEKIREDMELFAMKRNIHLLDKQFCFSRAENLTHAFLREIGHEDH